MSVDFLDQGTDLANVLAPRLSNWPQAAATGFHYNGTDLNVTFAPASTGTAAGSIGFRQSGTDVGPRFAAINSTQIVASASPFAISYSGALGYSGATGTTNTTTVTATKGYSAGYTYSWTNVSGSGTLHASGATAYVTAAPAAGATISGALNCYVSDGNTYQNLSVSYSVQNTSPALTSTINMVAQSAYIQLGNGTAVGYYPGDGLGTTSDLNPQTINGHTVVCLCIPNSTYTLYLYLNGNVGGSFTSIAFTGNDGVRRTFTAASGGAAYTGGVTVWSWSVGKQVFTAGVTYPITVVIP